MKWIFPSANKRSFLVLENIKEASGNEENIQRGPLSQSHPLQQPGPLGFPGLVAPDIFCTKTFGGAGWRGTHCSIRLGCPLNPWGSTHDCYIFHHLHFFLENQQDVSGEHTASKAGSYFHIFGSHCSHLPTISFSTSDPWVFKFLSAR